MLVDGYESLPDCITKFHNSVYVKGWFYHAADDLLSVRLKGSGIIHQYSRSNLEHAGVSARLGENRGFVVQALFAHAARVEELEIEWTTRHGRVIAAPLMEYANERVGVFPTFASHDRFRALIEARETKRILAIGDYQQSKLWKRTPIPEAEVTVFDLVARRGVDIAGDANKISSCFSAGSFDAICCYSAFEHLLAPWKVAIELNKVLKAGGLGFIYTHQAVGMHGVPSDYWRFSSDAWDAIFNARTGFRIVERAADTESFILPFIYRADKRDAERSAGYGGVAVLFEKISEPSLDWNVATSEGRQDPDKRTDDQDSEPPTYAPTTLRLARAEFRASSLRKCVYTCLIGGYEKLSEQPTAAVSAIPFICFTDDPNLVSQSWQIRQVKPILPMDYVRSQREVKLRPHLYLDDFDLSLYIDNSVRLTRPPASVFDAFAGESDFSMPLHSFRETVFDEFLEAARLGLDDQSRIFEQLNHYLIDCAEALQEPPFWGGILLRDHRSPRVREICEIWMAHVLRYSRRDQLSANVAFRACRAAPGVMRIDNHESWFHSWPHAQDRDRKRRAVSPGELFKPLAARVRELEQALAAERNGGCSGSGDA